MLKETPHSSLIVPPLSPLHKRRFSGFPVLSILFLVCTFLIFLPSAAQTRRINLDLNPNTGNITHDTIKTSYVVIKEISIKGNSVTKDKIILRETGYQVGDTIPTHILDKQLIWIKNRIFNTTLFLWVDLDLSSPDSTHKTLHIDVRERFYLSILPTGGLADRNFNEWWQDRNHDLARIYYGVNLKIKNILGLNHTLKIATNIGFNQKIEATYLIPYLNKKLRTGLTINSQLIYNRQVAFRTYEHKLDYLENFDFGRKKYKLEFLFTYRKKFYIQHQLGPYFQYTTIADTIAKLNPDYFLDGANFQRAFGIRYVYTYDKRDFINYPLKGYLLKLESDYQILSSQSNINVAGLRAEYTHYIPVTKKLYFATGVRGKISAPYHQPYYSQRGLGYHNEIISGYELYVVDGQVYGLIKNNLRYRLLSINPTIKILPFRRFRTVPLSVYFKIYSDAGYVVDNTYNPFNNFLSNRLLVGGGAGIDIVTYYDIVGRIEYSVNQLGETGIFLHLKAGL